MADRIAPYGLTALITGKNPTIKVTLPDGRILEVEASTPEEANQAARAFLDREEAYARLEGERGLIQDVDNRVRAVARGIPWGLGGGLDEASAALNTLDIPINAGGAMALARGGHGNPRRSDVLTPEKYQAWLDAQNRAYDKELAYQRARDEDYDARHPVESAAEQIGGGVAGTIAGMRAFGAPAIPESVGMRLLTGAGVGAGGGYVEGFARGEGGFENRNQQGKASALAGGVFGAGGSVAAEAVGVGYRAVASWLANRGVDAKSINILLDRLKAQGVTPQQAQARIAELGDDAMLADVTPGMQAFTGGTALADASAGNTIGQRLKTRREGGGGFLDKILDDSFGPANDPYTMKPGTNAFDSTALRNQRAFDEGRTKVLTAKDEAMTPAQLDARMLQSSDPENEYLAQGARNYVSRIGHKDIGIGHNSRGNPYAPIDRIMDRDSNAEKIARMIGAQKAEKLRRGLDTHATFIETSNAGEPIRQGGDTIADATRKFWEAEGKPGLLSKMIQSGAATTAATGSASAGAAAAAKVGADRFGQAMGNAFTRKSPSLIQKTAENLTGQGRMRDTLVRALIDKAEELPKRSQTARTIETLVRALLIAQAGRAGYEGLRLQSGGPR